MEKTSVITQAPCFQSSFVTEKISEICKYLAHLRLQHPHGAKSYNPTDAKIMKLFVYNKHTRGKLRYNILGKLGPISNSPR